MRFRNSRVRTKVTALLVSLAALWAFAAWVTLREGLNLVWVAVYDKGVAQPSETLLVELQQERRLTAVVLAQQSSADRAALTAQRSRTDAAAADFRRLSKAGDVQFAADDVLRRRIDELIRQLDGLRKNRGLVDGGQADRVKAFDGYTTVIDSVYDTYDALATLDDEGVAEDTRALIELSQARELLSQEDALLAGALSGGRLTVQERARFTQIVGAQRFHHSEAVQALPDGDRAAFDRLERTQAFTRLRALEEAVMESTRPGGLPPIGADQWRAATEPALAQLQKTILDAGDRLVERTTPVAVAVIARLLLAGVLGLVAVIASIVLSVTTARALVRQLEKLREAALELANERLPGVVARLAQGEKVDVRAEAPPLDFGPDVIGQVGAAFNTVQETAIRTAVEEAQLRQSIRDILLSLARRTQSLVHRQLTLLDVMERRESDPAELKDLFRIDHLATRMRRNAENLIVLSGASPARAWRRSVPMVDVVRGALAEVEDYTRVTVMPMGETALIGRAVGDVIHLLAELIENAVSFSPPYTMVQVGGQVVASGYAIEVEDRGLGMSAEDLEATNQRIADPPEFNLSSTARLGLYVVSRLAERHGIKVSLKASPYGGTTAVVLLPRDLVIEGGEDLPEEETGPGLPQREPGPRRIALVGAPEAVPGPVQEVVPVPRAPESPRPVQSAPLSGVADPDGPAPSAGFTPSGLPFRVPQANLAPALAEEPRNAGVAEEEEDRSPEDIRKIMGSFQSGTRRGRSEAAKMLGEEEDNL
ncbi:nitrate- and nitrite sensing domain-containing protein [Microbispora sp. NEAU-D428]|uniref:sensor histidine kinase n=1 Tax=Microbispora sitophila TaxID=2771537 RepID=UPI0018689347|nr:nitrate- and nitrite sensing domain-containing protein [Microbispora sitophila]MBE3013552.1 nitrate- and nitrite sensing domain-containing protein [Microbispora sitophila]